jgi:hypothetical protein
MGQNWFQNDNKQSSRGPDSMASVFKNKERPIAPVSPCHRPPLARRHRLGCNRLPNLSRPAPRCRLEIFPQRHRHASPRHLRLQRHRIRRYPRIPGLASPRFDLHGPLRRLMGRRNDHPRAALGRPSFRTKPNPGPHSSNPKTSSSKKSHPQAKPEGAWSMSPLARPALRPRSPVKCNA